MQNVKANCPKKGLCHQQVPIQGVIHMQPHTIPAKTVADRVSDRIVASVLGVDGLPLTGDAAIAHAAADEMQRLRGAGNSIPCVVREVVNGAVRAAQFTRIDAQAAARATILGVLRGARSAGVDIAPVLALTSERLVWSTAALGEKLSPCVRGALEGAIEAVSPKTAERQALIDLVISQTLAAVNQIDEEQIGEARREIATVVN
jgi:hypothetical protein